MFSLSFLSADPGGVLFVLLLFLSLSPRQLYSMGVYFRCFFLFISLFVYFLSFVVSDSGV